MGEGRFYSDWSIERQIWVLLGLITLVGTVLRLIQFGQSVTGDEVSTYWVVSNNNLADTVRVVSGDAEITPPLNFILSWFAVQLGSAPELVRLPAMIAGIAAIPLTYLLGVKTVGRRAGIVASAVMALSPFMVYFSGNGRAYTVLVLLLIGSTLTMLKAAETGSARWWVAYGLLSCGVMYSHYTGMFVLAAQLAWLLVVHRDTWKPALITNFGAAILFLPWVSGLRGDLDSPTTKVLQALQGDGFTVKRQAVEAWVVGHPFLPPSQMPGKVVTVVIALGVLGGIIFSARYFWKKAEGRFTLPSGLVLILMIALATPVAEGLLVLAGTDLFGARNMTASWYGLALAIGALITIPGGLVAIVCATLVLGGYAAASAKLLEPENSVVDFKGPAKVIDSESEPGDVVVDLFAVLATPVPTTPLDLQLDAELPTYNLNLPSTPPPFLPNASTITPDPVAEIEKAFREARGHRVFMLVPDVLTVEDAATSGKDLQDPLLIGRSILLPENATIVDSESWKGTIRPNLFTIEVE